MNTSDFTVEDYEKAMELMKRRLAGMSERLKNTEQELQREQRIWSSTIQNLQYPNMHAVDAPQMYNFLMELHDVVKQVLGIEHIRYGMYDYAHDEANPEENRKLAALMNKVLDYFDWDDR